MNSQESVEEFLDVFPEYNEYFDKHMEDYGELLLHIFYAEVINNPLFDLLKNNIDSEQIKKYVRFIEYMWSRGDERVQNVVDVTILERLSDDIDVWNNLGAYISEEFRNYINKDLLSHNCAMRNVEPI